ncbi:hypothetical protein WICMUC_001392 [Wickerhamomyces mucosus]|uniref:DNA polymerase n=1 Tax=Wickerhamomyces mucosus TaxID=1378264 RepID=A0A9P8PVJ1_9ASCO|nr:hypothetical protein WICMUC_001392 [Wickerhamomyces mucosus]
MVKNKERETLYATVGQSFEDSSFRIQINSFDTYQHTPTIFDRTSAPLNKDYSFYNVPVIRIFGSIPTGHKILSHIHGIYPYLYIPFFNTSCFELQKLMENVIAESLNRKKEDTEKSKKKDSNERIFKYVAHVSVCKGVPFYGYHIGYQKFFKIYLLNPSYLGRAADLLRNGVVTGHPLQVYESHIPFSLQFLTDFNLFGCGWLKAENVYLRTPILHDEDAKTNELIEYLMGYDSTDLERIGNSALEVDILSQSILNRLTLKEKNLHHDFVEKFNPLSQSQIYIQSTRELWKDSEYQRRSKGQPDYLSPPSVSRSPDVNWVESKENQRMFEYAKSLNASTGNLSFSNILCEKTELKSIPTIFQAFDELAHEPNFGDSAKQFFQISYENQEDNEDEELDDLIDLNLRNNIYEEADINEDELEECQIDDPLGNPLEVPTMNKDDSIKISDISDIQLTQQINNRFSNKRLYSKAFDETILSPISYNLLLPTKSEPPLVGKQRYIYNTPPPFKVSFESQGLPEIEYDDPFCMEQPPKAFIYGNRKFKLKSRLLLDLPQVEIFGASANIVLRPKVTSRDFISWKYVRSPPTYDEVYKYQEPKQSQIGVSQKFKFVTQLTNDRRPDGFNNLTLLVIEIFIKTRGELKADPNFDEVSAIFWRYVDGSTIESGVFITNPSQDIPDTNTQSFLTELEMFEDFALFCRLLDPDIVAGYEVHSSSWGYLIDRGRAKYEFDFMHELSRVTFKSHSKMGDHWGYTHTSSIKICGRHTLNIWRPLKEMKLNKNTIEYAAFHILHERIPHFTEKSLTELYKFDFLGLVNYYKKRCEIDTRLIEKGELVIQAAEEARLIGIDFNDVYYRGSQFKVESLMTRIAKTENFLLSSPSKKQVRNQKPLECIPLVMEPAAAYYKSPLVVLDFQSLYPSIIIAYNYCYSTLLGRLRNYSADSFNQIGTGRVKHPPGLLKLLENDINISPNGLMFAKQSVRKSLLAKMLEDLLDTRQMVKATMKFLEENLRQLYNSRQLALKLTANVTYGYTSASFSGRMPCSDIADAIVQTGRETLEKAIELIEMDPKWGAKVVYGDTDSLFVYLPGRSREEAFKIGKEMADFVTSKNPDPVTLKFEKVYHPSILMAKKRYVGYSFESLKQEPKFDAKGIETVRRDGHPALQYIVEQSLRRLFETNDITNIKKFVLDQFYKIINNEISIQDFCFARAVKIGTYKNPPPGAIVSAKKMEVDERDEPQYKERVPYVIIEETGSILRERARSPEDFIKKNLKLDSEYYIVKTLIPPLERIFNLLGVDVRSWYTDMPKKRNNLSIFRNDCLSCGSKSGGKLCHNCSQNELETILNMRSKLKKTEGKLKRLFAICRACCSNSENCESHDCPIYFTKVREINALKSQDNTRVQLHGLLNW